MSEQSLCEHEGCTAEATVECLNPGGEGYDEWTENLCSKHAVEEGFCCYCGNFWAGCEDFDFSPIPGVCPNCRESEWEDDWEEDEDGGLMLSPYYDDAQYADDALDWSDE